MGSSTLILTHAAVACFLAGLIWTIQLVHYPLLSSVGHEVYPVYQARHEQRITWVVAPAMLLEVLLAVSLAARQSPPPGTGCALFLLALIWASTFFLQVPAHRRLGKGFSTDAHTRLVRTNWIRTAAWTVRAVIAIGWALPPSQ